MAIRIQNIDFNKEGLKPRYGVSLGDITATLGKPIFIAPVPCVVQKIKVVSTQAVLGASSVAVTFRPRLGLNSDTALTSRGTSATATTSESLSANVAYILTPSANNSLTAGTVLVLDVSAQGSAVLSGVLVDVTYVPTLHKGS